MQETIAHRTSVLFGLFLAKEAVGVLKLVLLACFVLPLRIRDPCNGPLEPTDDFIKLLRAPSALQACWSVGTRAIGFL